MEHRLAKVFDSSSLEDSTTAAAHGKPSSTYGRRVMRPLVKLKKAIVEMIVSERGEHSSVGNGTSSYTPAYGPAFSMGMGMVPCAADFGASLYSSGHP